MSATSRPYDAADRAGNAAQELEPGDPGVAGGRGDEDAARAAAAAELVAGQDFDLRERLAEADDHAGHAAIADDEVGAEAERHDRRSFFQTGEEC